MSVAQGTDFISSAPTAAAASPITQSVHNTSAVAAHSLLSSSPRDLLTLPFRVLYGADRFAFSTLPRQAARMVGFNNMASRLWGSASGGGLEGDAMAAATHAAAEVAGEGAADAAGAAAQGSGHHIADIFQAIRRFSGFFSYLTSRWSLACFTVALILNRITIYASTRRPLNLSWNRRLALRIVPILLFLSQILVLLRAVRCQTSPDYSSIRYGSPDKRLIFDHAGGGGFLYSLGSKLLPWETDEQSCSAVSMALPGNASGIPYGSFTLLWPVFLRLCLSHFVETLSCSLQGRAVVTEAGMSIFEHSLAFAEAESMISQSIGLGIFGLPKQSSRGDDAMLSAEGSQSPIELLTRSQVLERMNVTPELLLIALISCCNSLTSNALDVIGKQSRYRLMNTAIWGFCFMAAIVWGMTSGSPFGNEVGVLKFPTVCIVGFVPHLLILVGILACVAIYGLALVITAFSLPTEDPQSISLRDRFMLAHENMQGANQISNIRFNRHEDFYTTLLRIGYTALTAASEAVFLNEGKGVVARNMTWLEEDRLTEIEASRRTRSHRRAGGSMRATPMEGGEYGNFDIPEAPVEWETGYGKEKKIEKPKPGSRSVRSQTDPGGVGAFRGAARCYHGFTFFRGIFYLLLRWAAHGLNKVLDRFGISARPQWLKKIAGARRKAQARNEGQAEPLDFWILTDDGELELPEDNEFDVEREMRKRERSNTTEWEQSDERRLDEKLYDWWKAGGSWGNQDYTPDYKPSDLEDFDDTTSVVSMSTNNDSEWEYESDGRRTPTPANPFPAGFSREGTPVNESLMDISSFARLLDPRDRETRQEARILAAHLAAERDGRILTRRQYQQQVERDQARVLLSSQLSRRAATHMDNEKRKPTVDEEFEMLENLILSRRSETSVGSGEDGKTWESGASGLGPDGPPCVICQTNPRSIITWPCRCLCVCEECRVSLAMNNFGSCVTCRQEVGGFVRLWVP
ncbi:hypothetical protein ASPWEDRAFT_39416 [Aspergillus wentii DTO 134E9]|uniref:RING-type domain-containing protein n=1 Tax=Aspergillus wentii DTO 134E9 TaxID=1073089 RepID=A0A1L9RRY6_ASPWE|nr:uncharacterized protein ASPWEDRAFT_39416 [Aspergillus wentii DTO 134E9]OJJ37682.1 hypothetical protein ASPWEDRAFT_39416 [Aspergillus wentii DTO 134E9]